MGPEFSLSITFQNFKGKSNFESLEILTANVQKLAQ
jgi:hypothetical protein